MKEQLPDHAAVKIVDEVTSLPDGIGDGALTFDGLDDGIVGYAVVYREGAWRGVLVYSRERLENLVYSNMKASMDSSDPYDDGQVRFDAMEHVEYNIAGGYLGPHTPIVVDQWL